MTTGSRLGRYELVEELGAGGMALVFRARDAQLGRHVAIKVLHRHMARQTDLVRRFAREARAAASLDHPNICEVFDVAEAAEGQPAYMVMELLDGVSLEEHFRRHGALVAEAALLLGKALADALCVAHQAGVVHRDLKPANVMLTEKGRVVLCDFGMARVGGDESVLTQTGAVFGTPAFMSPEQALGQALDPRSDVYSLGATLYRLTTGRLPAEGPGHVVVARVAQGTIEPPLRLAPAMGPDMASCLGWLMAHDPAERPDSADKVRGEFVRLLGSSGIDAPDEELGRYLADPSAWTQAWTPRLVAASSEQAEHALRRRRVPRAAALIDRALALAPGNSEANRLARKLATGNRRRGHLALAVAVAVIGGTVGGAWLALHEAPAPMVAVIDASVSVGHSELLVRPVETLIDAAGDTSRVASEDAAPEATIARPVRRRPRPPAVPPPAPAPAPEATPDAAAPASPPRPAPAPRAGAPGREAAPLVRSDHRRRTPGPLSPAPPHRAIPRPP